MNDDINVRATTLNAKPHSMLSMCFGAINNEQNIIGFVAIYVFHKSILKGRFIA